MNLAIIPARIGSKRIKKKNIKNFKGKPLIYFSIKAAIKSKLFDEIIVSTDSKEIRKLALKFGASVPFLRPKSLSDDYTKTQDVIKHSLKYMEKFKTNPNYICCIYPTAPMLNYRNIIKGYNKLKKKKYDFIFSASKFQSSVLRSFCFKNGKLSKLISKYMDKRSQNLPIYYYDVGQFYWASKSTWMNKNIFSSKSNIIEIPVLQGFDLNTNEDWKNLIKLSKIYEI